MNRILIYILLLTSILTANGQNSAINTLSEKEKEEGWKLLFNGKNLDGWKKFQGKDILGWHVVDGILTNSGAGSERGGNIITREKFQNFELVLDWKIASKGNSGIFYHVNEKIGKAIYESGPEYQIIDEKGWPEKLRGSQLSAANFGMHAPAKSVAKEAGEWNNARIVVNGTHVQHFLNGVKVVDYQLWDSDWKALKESGKWKEYPYYGLAKKGNIGLQDNGELLQFRNIKIKIIK